MNFRNLRKSYLSIFRFFLKKKNHKLLSFKVPSDVLFSYINYNIIERVSEKIDLALSGQDPLEVRRLVKLGWLISELRFNKTNNPVQLLYCGNNRYFCHPGTDRILVMCYINPTDYVEGFYVWYPEIDPHPFILDYEYKEIKNPFKFLSKFVFSDTLRIDESQLNKQVNVADGSLGKSHLSTAKKCFDQTGQDYDVSFLTFYDGMQWDHIDNKLVLSDVLTKIDDKTILLSGIKFIKQNNTWITCR